MQEPSTDSSTPAFYSAEFQLKCLEAALTQIHEEMRSVRAKRHWQREELTALKHHRAEISRHYSYLQSNPLLSFDNLNKLTQAEAAIADWEMGYGKS